VRRRLRAERARAAQAAARKRGGRREGPAFRDERDEAGQQVHTAGRPALCKVTGWSLCVKSLAVWQRAMEQLFDALGAAPGAELGRAWLPGLRSELHPHQRQGAWWMLSRSVRQLRTKRLRTKRRRALRCAPRLGDPR